MISTRVFGVHVPFDDHVVAGPAAHWAPVDQFFGPFWVVAEVGGRQMLDGVEAVGVHDRFSVGFFHADVEGGSDFSAYLIFAGDVDAPEHRLVIDGKTWDGFEIHDTLLGFSDDPRNQFCEVF
jgi:hypothetical protein